jgi:hypothetical protein
MSKVERKMVARFFVDLGGGGKRKGFATETLAYRALAIRELKWKIAVRADQLAVNHEEGMPFLEFVQEAYGEVFPHAADGSCIEGHNGKHCAGDRWVQGRDESGQFTYEFRFVYSWCRVAKEAWIQARVAELRQEA